MEKLTYQKGDRFVPQHEITPVTAEKFLLVDEKPGTILEGLIFDRNGDMYFTHVSESKIMKVDMKTKELSVFFDIPDKRFLPSAVKIHKNGDLYIAGVDYASDPAGEHGGIWILSPDTKEWRPLVTGWNVNDLVFDKEGGIYFNNYQGWPLNPVGSVEYIVPGTDTPVTLAGGLAGPNGIALSKDQTVLWITEVAAGMLHRICLYDRFHDTTPFKFEGFYGPDSISIDNDDNLYVAMARLGKIIVFNDRGCRIGEVLTPDCENGNHLGTTHPMVQPGNKVLYFTCHAQGADCGSWIMRCGSYAEGNETAYQFSV